MYRKMKEGCGVNINTDVDTTTLSLWNMKLDKVSNSNMLT